MEHSYGQDRSALPVMLERRLGQKLDDYARVRGLVFGAGGPIPEAYVPLDEGPTVLYGQNGSGKSFTLEALASCVRGYASPRLSAAAPALVLDFWKREADTEDYWTHLTASEYMAPGEHERDAFLQATTRAKSSEYAGRGEEIDPKGLSADLFRLVDHWNSEYSHMDVDLQALAEAVVTQWTYLVRPDGTKARPSWTLELAAFSEDHPLLADYSRCHTLDREAPLTKSSLIIRTPRRTYGHLLTAGRVFDSDILGSPFCLQEREPRQPDEATRRRLAFELDLGERSMPSGDDKVDTLNKAVVAMVKYADIVRGADNGERIAAPVRLFDPSGELSAWVMEWCERLSAASNRIFNAVLPHSRSLLLEAAPRAEWLHAPIFRWRTSAGLDAENLPLEWSSETEQRWAALAVDWALYPAQQGIVLLDEPEHGLHRFDEAHAIRELIEFIAASGMRTVVASHSPSFLNDPRVNVLRLNRTGATIEGLPVVQHLALTDRAELGSWGLLPSDLLQQIRVFLLVEGQGLWI